MASVSLFTGRARIGLESEKNCDNGRSNSAAARIDPQGPLRHSVQPPDSTAQLLTSHSVSNLDPVRREQQCSHFPQATSRRSQRFASTSSGRVSISASVFPSASETSNCVKWKGETVPGCLDVRFLPGPAAKKGINFFRRLVEQQVVPARASKRIGGRWPQHRSRDVLVPHRCRVHGHARKHTMRLHLNGKG